MLNRYRPHTLPRVLIFGEDTTVGEALQAEGVEVSMAAAEESLLVQVRSWHPEVVVLSFIADPMHSLAIAARLKREAIEPAPAVLLLLQQEDVSILEQARIAGVDDCLRLPASPALIRMRVGALANATRAQRGFNAVVDGVPTAMAVLDRNGEVLARNLAMELTLGSDAAALCSREARVLMAGTEVADTVVKTADGMRYRRERHYSRPDGKKFDGRLTVTARADGLIVVVLEDVTAANEALARVRQFNKMFDTTLDGIVITDARGNIIDANLGFTRVTGYRRDEVLGQNPRLLRSGWQGPEFYEEMWRELLREGRWQGEIWNRRKNGEIYPEWLTISAIKDARGEISQYVAIFSDITTIKENELRLTRLAHYDPLTGLPNRLLLQDRLEQTLAQARRLQSGAALLFIDLDRFKPINDRYGHAVGDRLLHALADRLRNALRDNDTVGRIGGDEFVVILPFTAGRDAVERVTDKLIEAIIQPFSIDGLEVQVGASVGISFYPADSEDAEVLLMLADKAMYRAKQAGGNCYRYALPLDRAPQEPGQ